MSNLSAIAPAGAVILLVTVTYASTPDPDVAPNLRDRLADVRDHAQSIEGYGLYLLLPHADRLDPENLLQDALPVQRKHLLDDPEIFRGRLVKVPVAFARTREFRPADRILWDRPAWAVTGLDPRQNNEPVTVILIDQPPTLQTFARVWAVGYFLKLRDAERQAPDPETGATNVTIPVLIGKLLPAVEGERGIARHIAAPCAAAILAIAYLLVRRAGRRPRSGGTGTYAPRRFEPAGQGETPAAQLDRIAGKEPAEALEILAAEDGSMPNDNPGKEPNA